MKHGRGESWDAATRYTGDWRQGKREGSGVFISAEYMYIGEFRKNLFDGKGQIVLADGRTLVGTFCEGVGQLRSENGFVRSCVWENGELKRVKHCTQPGKFNYRASCTWANSRNDNCN